LKVIMETVQKELTIMASKVLFKIKYAFIWLYFFGRFAVRQFYQQRGLQIASSLAYTTLLSLVPLITVMFGFLGGLPVFDTMGDSIQSFIFDNFVPAFGDTIQEYLREFAQKASQLTITNIAFLIVIALMLMATIDNALNLIWHVRIRRKPAARFLVYWAILTLGPLLVGIGLLSTTYLLSLSIISEMEATLGLRTLLLSWLPFLTTAVAFTLLYILLPNCFVSGRHALIGGIIAAIIFECAKYGFGVFVKSMGTHEAMYGAIAVIPVFLMWIYISWVVVILGAHITFCLSAFRFSAERSETRDPDWTFIDACRIITVLWSAQQDGKALTIPELRKQRIRSPYYQINEIMETLQQVSWVHRDIGGGWILSRDMSEIKLMDLYRIIPNRFPLEISSFADDEKSRQINELLQKHNNNLTELLSVPFVSIFK